MRTFKLNGALCAIFTFCLSLWGQNFLIDNDKILNEMVSNKINEIGLELYEKTKITTGVVVFNDSNISLSQKIKEISPQSPYAFILLNTSIKKVDIFADEESLKLFDKEKILSPYPERGTIIPILASRKGKDIYNASMLNGYGDLSDQIATSKNIKLNSTIGNSNKNVMNSLRYLVYGSILLVIFVLTYKRFRNKNA
ncbi:MAG: hypothetical protein K5978_07690 [Campylobacter sp.]|nr:hypothetical protein [Campylobacter sp.]